MDEANPYLKVAALASSLLLVAAFIGCRSGAIHPLSKPEPLPTTPPQPAPESPPVFLSGSKSLNVRGSIVGLTPLTRENTPDFMRDPNPFLDEGGLFGPGRSPPPPPQPAPGRKPVFMGGPKSAPVFGSAFDLPPAGPPKSAVPDP